MRIKKQYLYNGGKSFIAGELTVGQYYLFLRDPQLALEEALTEFGEAPQLNERQLHAFLDDLFGNKDPLKGLVKNKKRQKEQLDTLRLDFHLRYAWACKLMGFDVQHLPLVVYNRLLDDAEIVVDPKKYDPKRHDKTPDKKGFAELTGQGILHNNNNA